jgi:diguanylate cyclase (GGDEF)-like protein
MKLEKIYDLGRPWTLAGAMLFFLASTVLNNLTHHQMGFSPFYLFVVLVVSWNCGLYWGFLFAVLAVASELTADILPAVRDPSTVYLSVSAANRLVSYMVVVFLTTQLKKIHDREKATARIDFLTGAVNRMAFSEALVVEMARQHRTGQPFSVVYFDCDHFKTVNDRFGHEQGDQLLREMAQNAKNMLRKTDVVARLGGDEFALLLPGADENACVQALKKIRKALDDCVMGKEWNVTFSLGAGTFTSSPANSEAVVAFCDALMYEAKRSGRNKFVHKLFREEGVTIQIATGGID